MANPYLAKANASAASKAKALGCKLTKADAASRAGDGTTFVKAHSRAGRTESSVSGMKSGGRLDRAGRGKAKGAPMPVGATPGMTPTPMPPPGMSSGPMPAGMPGAAGLQKRGGKVEKYASGGKVGKYASGGTPQSAEVVGAKKINDFFDNALGIKKTASSSSASAKKEAPEYTGPKDPVTGNTAAWAGAKRRTSTQGYDEEGMKGTQGYEDYAKSADAPVTGNKATRTGRTLRTSTQGDDAIISGRGKAEDVPMPRPRPASAPSAQAPSEPEPSLTAADKVRLASDVASGRNVVYSRGGKTKKYATGGAIKNAEPKVLVKGNGQSKMPAMKDGSKSVMTDAEQQKFLKRASGGRASFPKKMKYGAGSGQGRLEKRG